MFNELFESVPLCEGKRDYQHSLYLSSNDIHRDKTLQKLAKYPLKNDEQIAFMTSGLFGLTAAHFRGKDFKIKYVLSIDYSAAMNLFWKVFSGLIVSAETQEALVLDLEKGLNEHKREFFFDRTDLERKEEVSLLMSELKEEIKQNHHFLSSKEGFLWAKALFSEKRFVHLSADLCDPKVGEAVYEVMKRLGAVFDTIFLTNVADFADIDEHLEEYYKTLTWLQKCSDGKTFVIDSSHREGSMLEYEYPLQRVRWKFPSAKLSIDFAPSPTKYSSRFMSVPEIDEAHSTSKGNFNKEINFKRAKEVLIEARKAPVLGHATTLLFCGDFFSLHLIWERGRDCGSSQKIDRILFFKQGKLDLQVWYDLSYLLIKAENRNQFLQGFAKSMLSLNLDAKKMMGRISDEIKEELGWLVSEESFRYVQGVFKRFHFVGFHQDPLHLETAQTIVSILEEKGEKIDTLCFSALEKGSSASLTKALKIYEPILCESGTVLKLD